MDTMSTHMEGTMRRARGIGVIVGWFVFAGVLAGCSSGQSDSAGSEANGGDSFAEAPAAVDSGAAEYSGDKASPEGTPRALITTGSLYITVEDPLAAADAAADVVKKAGGRVDARSESAPTERDGGSAMLTLRIPSDDLDPVVDQLRTLGEVDHYDTDSIDVSNEVTDLAARISTLRASTERIQKLLTDAKGLPDIITLEDELSRRQAELESLEAQQRSLKDQVSMSTIDLSLTTEPVEIVKDDDSPDSFWDGLVAGWNGLTATVSVVLVIAGVLLPWFALFALITLAVLIPIRARRARAAERAAASYAAALAAANAANAAQTPDPVAPPQ